MGARQMKKRTRNFQPSVTVIVPVFNAEKTVRKCILSLLALDYPENLLEFFFVDNASTDTTGLILRSFSDKIAVINETKKGPAAARNAGLRRARGEVVAFTDADCQVAPDWLRFLVQPLHDGRIGAVGGRILSQNPDRPIEKFWDIIHDHRQAIEEFNPPHVISMNWASRLSTLRSVAGFDEGCLRGEDVDLAYRLTQKGYRLVHEPRARIFHRNPGTLAGLFRKGFSHGFYSVKILKAHRDFVQECGHRRIQCQSYMALGSLFWDYCRDPRKKESLFHFLFDAGKKTGKWLGSLRFLHFDV